MRLCYCWRRPTGGVKRFVHCSSVGVIGDVKQPPADETTQCHPVNIYERTKLEGEQGALEFACQQAFQLLWFALPGFTDLLPAHGKIVPHNLKRALSDLW